MPTPQAIANREALQTIRRRMLAQEITYEEAANLAAPVIKRINDNAKVIAKRHGMPPQLVNFAAIMR